MDEPASDPDFQALVDSQEWLDAGALGASIPDAAFRAYVDTMPDSLVWLDPGFRILYCNTSFLNDFGLTRGSAIGRSVLDLVEGAGRDEMRGRLERALELTPDNPTRTEDFAGERAWLSSIYTGYFDDDGELVAISDLARDHTEKYTATRALEASNRRLAESNRDLQDFAYIASHDLQEPLRKIAAFGDRLAGKYDDVLDDRALDYLARIRGASGRMQTLIDDVLTFSRVSTHAAPPEPTAINEVVAGVLDDLEVAIGEADATVNVDELPTLAVDASQLRQLFQNLIANALKFRKPDVAPVLDITAEHVTPPDELGFDRGDVFWSIAVKDNGIGFDPKYRDKVFTVFQRLHGRGEYEGSGIGLAVCRRIVERHGGAITVESEEGVGSTFLIWLPVARQLDAAIGIDPAATADQVEQLANGFHDGG